MFYTECFHCGHKIWDGQDGVIAFNEAQIGHVVYCSVDCLMRHYDAHKNSITMRYELEIELEWHEDKRRKRLPNG